MIIQGIKADNGFKIDFTCDICGKNIIYFYNYLPFSSHNLRQQRNELACPICFSIHSIDLSNCDRPFKDCSWIGNLRGIGIMRIGIDFKIR